MWLQERLMEASDAFRVHVDSHSGLLAAANLKNQTFTSLHGDKSTEIVQVYMPYACKLLFQEMMSMCIVPRLRFEEPKLRKTKQ
jgi:DNA-directed RNA polymerase II subunit RPB2